MKIFILSVVLLTVVIYFHSPLSEDFISEKDIGESLRKIIAPIISIIPNVPSIPLNDCPQIKVPLKYSYFKDTNRFNQAYIGTGKLSNGWTVSPGSYFGDTIPCRAGSQRGENPTYWYCETVGTFGNRFNTISITLMNSDGTIGETIEKTFTNIYDENGNFVKTICGDSAEEEGKRGMKSAIADLDELFGG